MARETPALHAAFHTARTSWQNLVELFFVEITERRIRRGSYSSGGDLNSTIYDYFQQRIAKPKALICSKAADDIIARERRALSTLDEIRGAR